jgi:hypothetical protein
MCKPSCQETTGSHLEKYLMPPIDSLPMAAIDEKRVQEFIAALTRTEYAVSKGKKRRLSPKPIRNIVGVLKLPDMSQWSQISSSFHFCICCALKL